MNRARSSSIEKHASRTSATEPELVLALRDAMHALDVHAAYFMMRTSDEDRVVHHLLLACDARFGFEYAASDCSSSDPWIRYAIGHSAPVLCADIFCNSRREREVVQLAAKYGFADAALFPAPSPQGRSRIGLLVVGAESPRVRERFASTTYRSAARDTAMGLHERWIDRLKEDFARSAELSSLDIRILELELQGCRTKDIARHLGTTNASIHSRMQRLTSKLRLRNRRELALRSLELGVIGPTRYQGTLCPEPNAATRLTNDEIEPYLIDETPSVRHYPYTASR